MNQNICSEHFLLIILKVFTCSQCGLCVGYIKHSVVRQGDSPTVYTVALITVHFT